MKIYLGCTVRGDRTTIDVARHVARRLEAAGHEVLTTHLLLDDVESVERSRSSQEVYRRDVAWLDACDVLVAEASGSSYGVGFEVGYIVGRAPTTGQRAILLYRRDRHDTISRLISGLEGPSASAFAYETLEDVDRAIASLI